MKLRVTDLARKVGRTSDEVRAVLDSQGKSVKTNLSLVDATGTEAVIQYFKGVSDKAAVDSDKPHVVRATRGSMPSGVVKVTQAKRPKQPRTAKTDGPPAAGGEVKKPKVVKAPKRPGVPAMPSDIKEALAEEPVAPVKPRIILERIDVPPPGTPLPPVRRPSNAPATPAKPAAAPSNVAKKEVPESRINPAAPANAGTTRPKPGSSAIPQAARGQRASGGFSNRPKRGGAKKKNRKARREEIVPENTPEQSVEEMEARTLRVPENPSVNQLAEKIGLKPADLIKKLMLEHRMMATTNQKLTPEVAELLAADYNCALEYESLFAEEVLEVEIDDASKMVSRSPVVTIMGHVDHGKTSLLDAIRASNVAGGESGGITQHIGAYRVHLPQHDAFPGGSVTFLDTPGHEAFSAMRARGAKATDVVVLVVAADDSVMPQTIEAINHAKDAEVPIVVAINKIDKEGANIERVQQDLAKYGLQPEAWGGKTQMVSVSAKQKTGITELLEVLALESEILELKADPTRRAKGVIVEAKLDKGRGAVATVLVQTGTLRIGDPFVIGTHFGRVRALIDDHGKKVLEAGPATPVEILGLSGVPDAGDPFQAVENEKIAREISSKRAHAKKERDRGGSTKVHLDDLFAHIEAGEVKELRLLIKADGGGSAEALRESLEKIQSDKIKAKVIHAGVGDITESDVNLASASNAIIVGFHVKAQGSAVEHAHREEVEIRLYTVIYEAVDEIRDSMTGMLEPHFHDVESGKGLVKQVFRNKEGAIAGTLVESGKVVHDGSVRVLRMGNLIYEGKIQTLKRFKDNAKEVKEGQECGIGLPSEILLEEGDRLEFIATESVAQKL